MKRPQIQSHTTEPDSIDVQAFTDLEESERQNQKNDHSNRHQNQYSSNGHPVNRNEPVKLDESEPDNHNNGSSSNGQAATVDETVEDDLENETGQSKVGNKKKRRGLLLGIGAIILAAGSVFGVRWWQFQSTHVSTDNAQIKGHLSPISAKVPATVKQVLVNDGDYVKAGQTLVVLEDQDLNLKVQQ
ncbi:MAG TPA: biotin/lipoyl-binding protein, partial [Cyanophyceae cyanobacterium]